MAGIKPKGRVCSKWSANLAYAIGLITTDGCLYNDGRHISLTTTDREQASNFKVCLGLKVRIGKYLPVVNKKEAYRVQFGDVLFYRFLLSLGLTPAKSKTIKKVYIPDQYFFDFLRGCFDGDGSFYSYWDPRWKSSYMFYTCFVSASLGYTEWLRERICHFLDIMGHIAKSKKGEGNYYYQLKYAKADSLKLLRKIYYAQENICLSRKRLKINKSLGIIGEQI